MIYFTVEKYRRMISRLIRSLASLQSIVGVCFAVVWIQLSLSMLIDTFSIGLLILCPVFLLITGVQYQSHRAYFFVMSILIGSVGSYLVSIVGYINTLIQIDGGMIDLSLYSICIPCEIRKNTFYMSLGFFAISILHSSKMVEVYRWNARSFLLSLFNGGLLLSLILLMR